MTSNSLAGNLVVIHLTIEKASGKERSEEWHMGEAQ